LIMLRERIFAEPRIIAQVHQTVQSS
jgi:hypothetical protein